MKGPTTWDGYNSVTSTQEVSSPEINPVNESVGNKKVENGERMKSKGYFSLEQNELLKIPISKLV